MDQLLLFSHPSSSLPISCTSEMMEQILIAYMQTLRVGLSTMQYRQHLREDMLTTSSLSSTAHSIHQSLSQLNGQVTSLSYLSLDQMKEW